MSIVLYTLTILPFLEDIMKNLVVERVWEDLCHTVCFLELRFSKILEMYRLSISSINRYKNAVISYDDLQNLIARFISGKAKIRCRSTLSCLFSVNVKCICDFDIT